MKQIESLSELESYFKPIAQKELDEFTGFVIVLEDLYFSEDDAQFLGEQISRLSSIEALNLNVSGNGLDAEGIKHISAGIKKLTHLSELTLNLSFNKARTEGAEHLSGALSDLTELQSLSLDL